MAGDETATERSPSSRRGQGRVFEARGANMIWQLLSLAGAILILTAYGAHQMKHMHADTVLYQCLNLFGGLALFLTAVVTRQYGFMLMEGAWTVMSAFGLFKVLRGSHEDFMPLS
jgi:hypothetical protein